MLRRAAALVREVAKRWDVPLRQLTVAEVRAGKRGICGHADVSKAFRQSDHTDPGDAFPWAHFIALVNGEDDIEIVFVDGVPRWPGRTLVIASPMMRGEDVKVWQAKLEQRGWTVDVDGVFGPQSRSVCRGYQRATGLVETGQVDKSTWEMTWSWKPPAEPSKG